MASMLMGGLAPSAITERHIADLIAAPLPRPLTFRYMDGSVYRFSSFLQLMQHLRLDPGRMAAALMDFLITSYEYGLTPAPATQLRYAQARSNIISMGEDAVRVAEKFIRWVRKNGKLVDQRYAIAEPTALGTFKAAASFAPGFSAGPGKTITPYTRSMQIQDSAWNRSELTKLRAIDRATERAKLLNLNQRADTTLKFGNPKPGWGTLSLDIGVPTIKKREQDPAKVAARVAKMQDARLEKLRAKRYSDFYGSPALVKGPISYEQLMDLELERRAGVYQDRLQAIRELQNAAKAANQAAATAANIAATVAATTPTTLLPSA